MKQVKKKTRQELENELLKLKELNERYLKLNLSMESRIVKLEQINLQGNVYTDFLNKLLNSSLAYIFIEPDPIKLECSGTKAGNSEKYLISVTNIIAIKSDGRQKTIILKKAILPIDGGKPTMKIYINKNNMNWDKLLFMIQEKGIHLMKVNRTYAINIYYYCLNEKHSMLLNSQYLSITDKSLHKIKIGSDFPIEQYHKRLIEIYKLSEDFYKYQLSDEKIEEISRDIKELNVTKSKKHA